MPDGHLQAARFSTVIPSLINAIANPAASNPMLPTSGSNPGARSSGSFAAMCAQQLAPRSADQNPPSAGATGGGVPQAVSKIVPSGTPKTKDGAKNLVPSATNALPLLLLVPTPPPPSAEMAFALAANNLAPDPSSPPATTPSAGTNDPNAAAPSTLETALGSSVPSPAVDPTANLPVARITATSSASPKPDQLPQPATTQPNIPPSPTQESFPLEASASSISNRVAAPQPQTADSLPTPQIADSAISASTPPTTPAQNGKGTDASIFSALEFAVLTPPSPSAATAGNSPSPTVAPTIIPPPPAPSAIPAAQPVAWQNVVVSSSPTPNHPNSPQRPAPSQSPQTSSSSHNLPTPDILDKLRSGISPSAADALVSSDLQLGSQWLSSVVAPTNVLSPPSAQAANPPNSSPAPTTGGHIGNPATGSGVQTTSNPQPGSTPESPPAVASPSDPAVRKNPISSSDSTVGPATGSLPLAPPQAGVTSPGTAALVDPAIQVATGQPATPASNPKAGVNASVPGPAENGPAAAETPAALPAGPVQMAQMVSKAAQSEMRIGMNTSAFGSVEVRTVVHANDVGVVIGSERGDLRSLLSTELPSIANSLQQQNLRLNQVNFHQGFAFSNNQPSGGESQPRYAPRMARATGGREEASSSPADEPADARMQYGNGFSVLA